MWFDLGPLLGSLLNLVLLIAGAVISPIAILWALVRRASRKAAVARWHALAVQNALKRGEPLDIVRRQALPRDLPANWRIRVVDLDGRCWVDSAPDGAERLSIAQVLRWIHRPLSSMPAGFEPIWHDRRLWGYYLLTDEDPRTGAQAGDALFRWVPRTFAVWMDSWVRRLSLRLIGIAPLQRLQRIVRKMWLVTDRMVGQPASNTPGADIAELEALVDQIETLRRHRRDLLRMLAHDMKTPLGIIQLNAQFYRKKPDADAEVLDDILHATSQLLNLVTGMPVYADLLALEPERKPVSLTALVERTVAGFKQPFATDGSALNAELPGDPLVVVADAILLERVLNNLLENARKYGGTGGRVSVRAFRTGDAARVEVQDTGPGLTEYDRQHIFHPYYRSDEARRGHTGGWGLGLASVHEIIALHSGRRGVDTSPGGGSIFWIELPLTAAQQL